VIAVYQQKDIDHFNVIARSLEESLNTDARRAGFFEIQDASYNPLREQYNLFPGITSISQTLYRFRCLYILTLIGLYVFYSDLIPLHSVSYNH